jgi:hypothetical protein
MEKAFSITIYQYNDSLWPESACEAITAIDQKD